MSDPGAISVSMSSFTITPDGPFSLAAAAAFGFGPNTGRPTPGRGEMRLAFVTDDMRHHAAVHLAERSDGAITAAIESDADPDAVLRQVLRILSLDQPGRPVGGARRARPGARHAPACA